MERLGMLLLGYGIAAERLAGLLDIPLLDVGRDDVEAVLAEATRARIDLILFAACADGALQPRAFESLTDADWREGVDRPLEALLRTLQTLGARYPISPPPVVVTGPSMALSGGDGLVLLAAAAEGQRALMKSAARQWGPRGFRFTWVAIDTLLFAPGLEGAALPKAQDPDPLALDTRPGAGQLCDLLSLLADPRAAAMTGQSLVLDGGELMLP